MTEKTIEQQVLEYLQDMYPEAAKGKDIAEAIGKTETKIRSAAECLAKNKEIKLTILPIGFLAKANEPSNRPGIGLHDPYTPSTKSQPKAKTEEKKKAPPKYNKPFTPNPTTGYQVCKGKVKIFLDRRACGHTVTLSIDDLRGLLTALEKAGD